MTFEQARAEWDRIRDDLDEATTQVHRVSRDPLPINTEDATVMQARLADVQRRLERLLRGLGG